MDTTTAEQISSSILSSSWRNPSSSAQLPRGCKTVRTSRIIKPKLQMSAGYEYGLPVMRSARHTPRRMHTARIHAQRHEKRIEWPCLCRPSAQAERRAWRHVGGGAALRASESLRAAELLADAEVRELRADKRGSSARCCLNHPTPWKKAASGSRASCSRKTSDPCHVCSPYKQ
eukprot:5577467-Pleurochrysis_carterae.AAC.2